jgi:hypothetical protein
MTKPKPLLSFEELDSVFKIDETSPSGLRWKKGKSTGLKAGGIRNGQYWFVKYKGECWSCQRIIWMLAFQQDPGIMEIDHIDQNKQNNKLENLRLASKASNCHNRQLCQEIKNKKTSKYKGVYWHKPRNRWRARIVVRRKAIELGRYINEIDAAKAYDRAAKKFYGEFAVLNFPKDK